MNVTDRNTGWFFFVVNEGWSNPNWILVFFGWEKEMPVCGKSRIIVSKIESGIHS